MDSAINTAEPQVTLVVVPRERFSCARESFSSSSCKTRSRTDKGRTFGILYRFTALSFFYLHQTRKNLINQLIFCLASG